MPTITLKDTNAAPAPIAQATEAQSARERAIAMLAGGAPANQNQNNVSVEEIKAVSPAETTGQAAISEPAAAEATPAAESPEAKPAADPLSKQYAVLARKEKALRAQIQQMRQKEVELKAREEALGKAPSPTIDESKYISRDRLTTNPLEALLESGITYEQLTQLALNPPPQQDPATKLALEQLRREVKAATEAQESIKKTYEQQQQQSYQQAVNQIRTEAKQLVYTDPTFETIKATGSVNDVVELIERTFQKDNILMSVEEAAQEVENYLVDEALKLARLKKIQNKLLPQGGTQPAAKQQQQAQQQPPQQSKTLTNAVASGRKLSPRERAMLAFKGELK